MLGSLGIVNVRSDGLLRALSRTSSHALSRGLSLSLSLSIYIYMYTYIHIHML